jgi:hypothetical protein
MTTFFKAVKLADAPFRLALQLWAEERGEVLGILNRNDALHRGRNLIGASTAQ